MDRSQQQLAPETLKELVALYAQGQYRDLADRAKNLVPDHPQSHQLHNLIGAAEAGLGNVDSALAAYQDSVQLKPDYFEAYSNMGATLFHAGRYEDAVEACNRALRIAPDHVQALGNLGASLIALMRYVEAEAPLRRAVKVQPGNTAVLGSLGAALYKQGKFDAAFDVFESALRASPDDPQAMTNYGIVLGDRGRQDEAAAFLRKALDSRPDLAEAHFHLAMQKSFTADDPQIQAMEELAADPSLSDLAAMQLCFALGRAYEHLGETEAAFERYQQGNGLRRRLTPYDIEDDRVLFERIKAAFAPSKPGPVLAGDAGPVPVFILGMPRSGTTLVEQILSSHSQVHGAGELEFLQAAVAAVDWMHPGAAAEVRRRYLSDLASLGVTGGIVTDKMPLNFRFVGFMRTALPEAKIIHMRRDARATCWSIYSKLFGGIGTRFGYDLAEVAGYYALYADLMQFWEKVFPGQIHHLNYKALTENQEEETRRLVAFAGLEWEHSCLSFEKSGRRVSTASAHQARRPLYTGSSEAWRPFEPFLWPMLEKLKGL